MLIILLILFIVFFKMVWII